jgi:hypothetical protein
MQQLIFSALIWPVQLLKDLFSRKITCFAFVLQYLIFADHLLYIQQYLVHFNLKNNVPLVAPSQVIYAYRWSFVDYRAIPDKKNNELPASGVSTPR